MKNRVLLLTVAACTFSFSCFPQSNEVFMVNTKLENMQLLSDRMTKNEMVIVSYHVEERINKKLGSSITTYNVSNLSLIDTNDLGENNTRRVTPKYARAKVVGLDNELPEAHLVKLVSNNEIVADLCIPDPKRAYIRINILRTYERVLGKGYLSVEMLKKVGDWRYFEGDLEVAAKWYTELYCMTTDLDTTFYYRYALSLKAIGQMEKAKEMMTIFEKDLD